MPALVRLLAAGLCAVAAASAVQAQTRRSVAPVANPMPAAAARAATGAPNPAGLRPIFPAGITSGSGAAVSSDRIAAGAAPVPPSSARPVTTTIGGNGAIIPEIPSVDTNTNAAAAAATQVLGAGPSVPGPSQNLNSGAGGFSATDIARSFYFADANHDGELTPAETSRLSIRSLSFEQMDRNYDGVISRFEYEDSVR